MAITLGQGLTLGAGITFGAGSGGGGGGGNPLLSSIIYTFDSGHISGSTVTDQGSGHYNATLVGSPTTGTDGHGAYVHLTGGAYIDVGRTIDSTPFTITIVQAIDNSNGYWASYWGAESWSAGQGYLAYQDSNAQLEVGQGGGSSVNYDLGSTSYTNIAQWDFVVTNSNSTVYFNGSALNHVYGTDSLSPPSGGFSTNNLFIGSRHTNGGSGSTDTLNTKIYKVVITPSALSSGQVASNYSTNQSTFSI